jgi:hypothetical protein
VPDSSWDVPVGAHERVRCLVQVPRGIGGHLVTVGVLPRSESFRSCRCVRRTWTRPTCQRSHASSRRSVRGDGRPLPGRARPVLGRRYGVVCAARSRRTAPVDPRGRHVALSGRRPSATAACPLGLILGDPDFVTGADCHGAASQRYSLAEWLAMVAAAAYHALALLARLAPVASLDCSGFPMARGHWRSREPEAGIHAAEHARLAGWERKAAHQADGHVSREHANSRPKKPVRPSARAVLHQS